MMVVVLVIHLIVGVGGGVGFDCLVIHPRLDHLSSRKMLTGVRDGSTWEPRLKGYHEKFGFVFRFVNSLCCFRFISSLNFSAFRCNVWGGSGGGVGGEGVRGRPLKAQTANWCDMRTSTSSKFDKDLEPAP